VEPSLVRRDMRHQMQERPTQSSVTDTTRGRVATWPAFGIAGAPTDQMEPMDAPQDATGLMGSNEVEQQGKETSSMASFQATLASWKRKETAEKGAPVAAPCPQIEVKAAMNAADKATWLRQRLAAILGDDETGEGMEQPAATAAEPMVAASARTGATEQKIKTVSAPGKDGREKNAADKATWLCQQLAAIWNDDETDDEEMTQPDATVDVPVVAAPLCVGESETATTDAPSESGQNRKNEITRGGDTHDGQGLGVPDGTRDGGSIQDDTEAQRKGRLLRLLLCGRHIEDKTDVAATLRHDEKNDEEEPKGSPMDQWSHEAVGIREEQMSAEEYYTEWLDDEDVPTVTLLRSRQLVGACYFAARQAEDDQDAWDRSAFWLHSLSETLWEGDGLWKNDSNMTTEEHHMSIAWVREALRLYQLAHACRLLTLHSSAHPSEDGVVNTRNMDRLFHTADAAAKKYCEFELHEGQDEQTNIQKALTRYHKQRLSAIAEARRVYGSAATEYITTDMACRSLPCDLFEETTTTTAEMTATECIAEDMARRSLPRDQQQTNKTNPAGACGPADDGRPLGRPPEETTEQMAMAARETTTEITTERMTVETTVMNTTEIMAAVTPPKIHQKLAMQRSPPGTAPREPQQTNRKNRLPAMAGDGGGRPPGRPPD
jgi:sulfur relay (sulfurtransferase) DsrC/TusE family protein